MDNEIKLFEGNQIRSIWDSEKEEWYFSVVDVVGVLTDSKNPRRYWSDLKRKIKDEEGAIQLYENIVQLKLKAPDGKWERQMLRICKEYFVSYNLFHHQRREPFKMWLAEVGKERIDEIIDPELTIDRSFRNLS
ncbi:hypothetical protein ONA24_02365 [Mycoplasmopsis cynos]|uniref:hypothetical protein n=1 Tax=Mycoplasmopsis cynos TaxID=171284 RepID=UPI0024C74A8E|nr:hypothetical protein [Mycoplasmopsis cynos]WAM10121.1 hypothetical protein ONA24_02365 [Mycoplasmopsis cynos]